MREGAQLPASELVRRLHFDYEIAVRYGIRMCELHRRAGIAYHVTTSYFELIFLRQAEKIFSDVKQQYQFEDCVSPITGRRLSFDFFINDVKVLVEIDGDHHWNRNHMLHSKKLEVHDKTKDEYSKSHGFELIRIPASPKRTFEQRVDSLLKQINSGRCKTH